MLIELDGLLLAEAFPVALRDEAILAGKAAAQNLYPRQWTNRFPVCVMGETVLIPARLHFVSIGAPLPLNDSAGMMARSLQTRSNDGFERQRAVRDILADAQAWSAPFIVSLIGEYVDQILMDIDAAFTPQLIRILTEFIDTNPGYWDTTKRRIASYWNVYYRHSYTRSQYVGFRIIERLEGARCLRGN